MTVYCDRCGLNFLPKQSVCTRCKRVPTRYWFQFMSLVSIFVAVLCNSILGVFLLPRLAMAKHGQLLFRGWYWFDQKAALYGWVPLAIGLLAWDYFVWKEARPKVKGWFTRKLLTFSRKRQQFARKPAFDFRPGFFPYEIVPGQQTDGQGNPAIQGGLLVEPVPAAKQELPMFGHRQPRQ